MVNLSKKLQEKRNAQGISVYRLSKMSDVSENYIHKIEKGYTQPSVVVLNKLLTCLGITLSEFFNEDEAIIYPTKFEYELIESIRKLPTEKAVVVLQIAKMLSQ